MRKALALLAALCLYFGGFVAATPTAPAFAAPAVLCTAEGLVAPDGEDAPRAPGHKTCPCCLVGCCHAAAPPPNAVLPPARAGATRVRRHRLRTAGTPRAGTARMAHRPRDPPFA